MDEEFKVDTLEKAAAVMRKYRSLAQRVQEIKDLANAERDRIGAWEQRASASVESQMEFYEGHLQAFGMMQRAEGRKSVSLPDGDIKTRTTAPSFEVDRATFLAWAEEHKRDDVMRVSFAPDMAAIKSTFLPDGGVVVDPASGEVVPGLIPVPERVTVSLAPDMDATDLVEEDDDDIY